MRQFIRAAVVVAGCASAGLAQAQQQPLLNPIDPATGQPLAQQGVEPTELQTRLASLEARLGRLEKVFENQVLRELLQSVDALQSEIRELRGEIESQYNELDILEKRQRDLYRDSDQRLRDLELGMGTGGSRASAGVTTGLPEAPEPAEPAQAPAVQRTTTAAVTQSSGGSEADEKAAYIAAFEFLKTGQYREAIKSYQAFLDKYPSGRYADNAQYWMGEANYVSREFEQALIQFQKVVASFPASPKVSDARLKIGFALYEMQRWDDARAALQKVIEDYPNSSVARLARQRIVRMKEEGH